MYMDNLRSLLGRKRVERILYTQDGELCDVKKVVDEMNAESALRWFDHIERTENSRIAGTVWEGAYGSRLVGLPQKRWIAQGF